MPEGTTGPRRTSAEVTGPRRTTGRQAIITVVEGTTDPAQRGKKPNPSYNHLLRPKVLTAVSRASRTGERGHGWRWTLVAAIGLVFWSFMLFVLTRVLTVLPQHARDRRAARGKAARPDAHRLLHRFCCCRTSSPRSRPSFSRRISTCSSPRRWTGSRCTRPSCSETLLHSSWMVVLMAVPMFAAYGVVYQGGSMFPFIVIGDVHPVSDHPRGRRRRDRDHSRERVSRRGARRTS